MERNMKPLVYKGIRSIAAALCCSTTTAQALVKREDFPVARIGKTVVVSRSGLEAWLAAGGTDQKAVG